MEKGTTAIDSFPVRIWQLSWFAIISVFGSLGNASVVYLAFSKSKGGIDKRAPFNVYLTTMAITDLVICSTCVPIYVMSTDLFDHPGGIAGDWMCKLVTGYFLPFWMLDFSAFLLVAIAIERRRAILKPFTSLQEPNLPCTLLIVFGLLISSVATQGFVLYGSVYTSKNATIGNKCTYGAIDRLPMRFLHHFAYILKCVIPTIIFGICFYQMHKKISKTTENLYSIPVGCEESRVHYERLQKSSKRKRQTVNTMRLVVVAFLVCVAINETFFMFLKPVLGVTNILWTSEGYQITVMLRFTNSCINPLLYSFKSQIFRKRFQETFFGKTYKKEFPEIIRPKRLSKKEQRSLARSPTPKFNGGVSPIPPSVI